MTVLHTNATNNATIKQRLDVYILVRLFFFYNSKNLNYWGTLFFTTRARVSVEWIFINDFVEVFWIQYIPHVIMCLSQTAEKIDKQRG